MPKNNGYDPYMGRPDDWEDQLEKDIAFFDEFAKRIKNSFKERNKDNIYMINPKVAKKMEFVASEMYELCGGKWAEDDGDLEIKLDFESDPLRSRANVLVKAYRMSLNAADTQRFLKAASMATTMSIGGVYPPYKDCKVEFIFSFADAFIAPSDIKKK